MSFKKFTDTDVNINSVKLYPKNEFVFYDGKLYYLQEPHVSASNGSELGVASGDLSLLELNVNRKDNLIYPFVEKGGSHVSLRGISQELYNDNFGYGDVITGSYPLSASISRDDVKGTKKRKIRSLRVPMQKYQQLSHHFQYESNLVGNIIEKDLCIINIPKIFYGDRLKKGSIKLDMYVTGTLIGTLQDSNQNGELRQTGPKGSTGSGSVAGLAFYDEGLLVLTASWGLSSRQYLFDSVAGVSSSFQWRDFMFGLKDGNLKSSYPDVYHSGSYQLFFEGQNTTEVLTMFCHANKGEMNYSNNPSFKDKNFSFQATNNSNGAFVPGYKMTNTVTGSSYDLPEARKNQVFINTIGIYDKNKKLIAVAKLAKPIRKRENDSYTFKLKMDI